MYKTSIVPPTSQKSANVNPSYTTLKTICEGRELLAYDAAAEFTQRAAAELDELLSGLGGDSGSMETLEKLEEAAQKWADSLTKLLQENAQVSEPSEQRDKALVGAANQLASKQKQAEAVAQIIDSSLLRQEDATDAIVGAALSAAKAHVEETRDILAAWSDEPGDLTRRPMNTELLRRVRQSQSLVDISRYLGRFREIFAQSRKNGYAYGRGEKYSLELGNDLSKALTSELAMLATPVTTPLFLQKYRTKQIKQYRRREPVFKGMGDIVCCLDESGSTEGESAAWGKAVAMTLLEIAASIAFFRSFMQEHGEYEAMAVLFWDKQEHQFFAYVPKQTVMKDQIDADLTDCPYDDDSRYIRYADIHSHNSMEAFFSAVDDADERGTGIYMVLGSLDRFFPEIKTRIACGGSFVEIDPNVVIEGLEQPYPPEWNGMVSCKKGSAFSGKPLDRLTEGCLS